MLGRFRPLRVAWLCALLPLWLSCAEQDALLLALRTPVGTSVKSYSIQVQDQVAHSIIYHSGARPVDAGRDLASSPLRVGLQLQQAGPYLVVVQAVSTAAAGAPLFFAGLYAGTGQQEVDALLLPVDPGDDADGDTFPDAQTWLKSQPLAKALYQGNLAVLDCVDKPAALDGAVPSTITPAQINPFAAPRCAVQLRPAGDPTGKLADFDVTCAGDPQKCLDADGDGDPADTDCDDHDPHRFHGNPRPRNCCQCTDHASCLLDHATLTDMNLCSPPRCGTLYDYDCTGQEVDCFRDDDCDGFSPDDPTPGQADCDDHNPNVYPGAPKNCADPSHDWACDGNPQGGCVPCDLDGDGFERLDATAGCPDATYKAGGKPVDCNDNDSGVYPGSTSNQSGASQLFQDLHQPPAGTPYATVALGGTVAGAMRGLCRNTNPDGTQQDANCDGLPRDGCPPATGTTGKVCDADGDGFPNSNPGCNPLGYALDCNDSDPHTFPGAPDLCGDGIAQDCAADHTCTSDSDHDGYNAADDCNDNDATIHPWAAETCDGKDDDCDGLTDELNPDTTGKPMVQTVSGTSFILSCSDSNLGQCGNTVSPSRYTGRCVCSSVVPNTNPNQADRTACPGTTQDDQHTPKCFGANQPATKETCDGINDECLATWTLATDGTGTDGKDDCLTGTATTCCATIPMCVDTGTSVTNCGGCGTVCSTNNITAACTSGVCNGACNAGFADCNNNKQSDGCETSISANVSDCGACGTVCSTNNINRTCAGGVCNGTCNTGFADCNNNKQSDGCEIQTSTDVNNCGACGTVCSTNNITRACSGGVCSGACSTGFADCNNNKQSDGCEIQTSTDVNNCGGCGTVCSSLNINRACTGGVCNGTCNAGYTDCNNNLQADGCETHISADVNNCGGCSTACSTNNILRACSGGVCNGTCNAGFADCNNNKQSDGCEVQTSTDVNNCGTCATVCSNNNISRACSGGVCNGTCNAGFSDCDNNKQSNGCETQVLGTDVTNCGGCGTVCSNNNIPMATCAAGVCNGACAAGFADCDNNKQTDGCETQITGTDVSNCGGCNVTCSSENITPACAAGVCNGTCSAGYADCDNNKQTNGCETQISNNVNSCGACGKVCPVPMNGIATCTAGTCGISCNTGFSACNGACVNEQTDPANCGMCANACGAGQNCCTGMCSTPNTDNSNCGMCGNVCAMGTTCTMGACM